MEYGGKPRRVVVATAFTSSELRGVDGRLLRTDGQSGGWQRIRGAGYAQALYSSRETDEADVDACGGEEGCRALGVNGSGLGGS